MEQIEKKGKKERNFFAMLVLVGLALSIRTYSQGVAITDIEVLRFAQIIAVVQYAVLFFYFYFCLKTVRKERVDTIGQLLVFYCIFAVPYICGYDQLGTKSVMMVTVTLVYAMFFIKGKWNVLLYVVPVIGMFMQVEYIFAYFGVFAVSLFYQYCQEKNTEEKKKWKNRLIISTTITLIMAVGVLISDIMGYSQLIQIGTKDMRPHGGNLLEMLFFLVLFSPYLFLAYCLFKKIMEKARQQKQVLCYGVIAGGGASFIPLYLLHCHYGKWTFALISYYMIVFIALLIKRDRIVEEALYELIDKLRTKYGWSILLLMYPVMFVPFSNMNICEVTRTFAEDVKAMLQIVGIMR